MTGPFSGPTPEDLDAMSAAFARNHPSAVPPPTGEAAPLPEVREVEAERIPPPDVRFSPNFRPPVGPQLDDDGFLPEI